MLEGNGAPSMVERTLIRPPSARVGPITPEERKAIARAQSPVRGKYDTAVDRGIRLRDAAEARGATAEPGRRPARRRRQAGGLLGDLGGVLGSIFGTTRKRGERLADQRQTIAREVTRTRRPERVAGQIARAIVGSSLGRALVRGIGRHRCGGERHPRARSGSRSRRCGARLPDWHRVR